MCEQGVRVQFEGISVRVCVRGYQCEDSPGMFGQAKLSSIALIPGTS